MGSELLLSTLLQNTVNGSAGPHGLAVTSEGPYDFYQQPNMSEARLCLPVLEQLGVAVKQRLEDWPEHPALVQVCGQGCSKLACWPCFYLWGRAACFLSVDGFTEVAFKIYGYIKIFFVKDYFKLILFHLSPKQTLLCGCLI